MAVPLKTQYPQPTMTISPMTTIGSRKIETMKGGSSGKRRLSDEYQSLGPTLRTVPALARAGAYYKQLPIPHGLSTVATG